METILGQGRNIEEVPQNEEGPMTLKLEESTCQNDVRCLARDSQGVSTSTGCFGRWPYSIPRADKIVFLEEFPRLMPPISVD